MKKDFQNALVQETRKARREFFRTPLGRLQGLCALRTKWRRRETIARNKLEEIEDEIDTLAAELANRKDT